MLLAPTATFSILRTVSMPSITCVGVVVGVGVRVRVRVGVGVGFEVRTVGG